MQSPRPWASLHLHGRISDALHQAQRDWTAGLKAYGSADYQLAQKDLQAVYETLRRVLGDGDARTLDAGNDLAAATAKLGNYTAAEALYRDLYNEQARNGSGLRVGFRTLNNLAVTLLEQGRVNEAENLDLRNYDEERRSLSKNDNLTLATLDNLCSALLQQGRYREAEARLKELYQTRLQTSGPNLPSTLTALANLTEAVENQGRHQEAEKLASQLYAARTKVAGVDHPDTVAALVLLATAIEGGIALPRLKSCCVRHFRPVRRDLANRIPESLKIKAALARVLRSEFKLEESAELYRNTCYHLAQRAPPTRRVGATQSSATSDCYYRLALTLSDLRSRDLASAMALGAEAFEAAQRSVQAGSATSLSRSNVIALAQAAGVGTEASQYETALDDRDVLQLRFVQALAVIERQRLSQDIQQLDAKIGDLASELATRAPDYWSYRSPGPVSIASLQQANGTGRELLHDEEALVLWTCKKDNSHGLVFAVAPDKFGWSTIALTGNEMTERVQNLRAAIEATEATATGASAPSQTVFPRAAAHELYQALLGDKSIQAVIGNAHTILFVPCEPVVNLPPSLLIVSDPPGGVSADGVPAMLRRTHWLIADKAVAALPTVSSLDILRRRRKPVERQISEPLVAFADPDFSNARASGDRADKWLAALQPLPGTRLEAESLRSILNGSNQDVLIGPEASKAELERRARDGSLARANVIDFATHGFIAGEIPGYRKRRLRSLRLRRDLECRVSF